MRMERVRWRDVTCALQTLEPRARCLYGTQGKRVRKMCVRHGVCTPSRGWTANSTEPALMGEQSGRTFDQVSTILPISKNAVASERVELDWYHSRVRAEKHLSPPPGRKFRQKMDLQQSLKNMPRTRARARAPSSVPTLTLALVKGFRHVSDACVKR